MIFNSDTGFHKNKNLIETAFQPLDHFQAYKSSIQIIILNWNINITV